MIGCILLPFNHFGIHSDMFTRQLLRRLSTSSSTEHRSRLFRWLDIYEDFVGLKEVKQAQTAVNDVI